MDHPPTKRRASSTRGFKAASRLLRGVMRQPFERRGFAEAKLLTHWAEIVGPDLSEIAVPVKITHGRNGGLGGTLVLLTTGSQAPILEMQKAQIKDRVNACYGYRAVSRVQITQTAPTGFAEGQVAFETKPKAARRPDPASTAKAERAAAEVKDPGLKAALTRLGANVMTQSKS